MSGMVTEGLNRSSRALVSTLKPWLVSMVCRLSRLESMASKWSLSSFLARGEWAGEPEPQTHSCREGLSLGYTHSLDGAPRHPQHGLGGQCVCVYIHTQLEGAGRAVVSSVPSMTTEGRVQLGPQDTGTRLEGLGGDQGWGKKAPGDEGFSSSAVFQA